MKFTPKISAGAVISGVLAIAIVSIGITHSIRSNSVNPSQSSLDTQSSPQAWDIAPVQVTAAVDWSTTLANRPEYYQRVSAWYKNKHWWKRNAPIVGGAAGGALIGGLAGGGTGALIGGAIGGGGGYAYKRLKHHHSEHEEYHHDYRDHHSDHQYHNTGNGGGRN